VPEQFALDQSRRDRRAIDRDEWLNGLRLALFLFEQSV
jgi:hypothetical protein